MPLRTPATSTSPGAPWLRGPGQSVTRQSRSSALSSEEPADQPTQHQTQLRPERHVGGYAEQDAESEADHSTERDCGGDAHPAHATPTAPRLRGPRAGRRIPRRGRPSRSVRPQVSDADFEWCATFSAASGHPKEYEDPALVLRQPFNLDLNFAEHRDPIGHEVEDVLTATYRRRTDATVRNPFSVHVYRLNRLARVASPLAA
jgi:hypothetical protein